MWRQFPILSKQIHEYPLIYLDNGATMQMPRAVMEKMQAFYTESNANIHRGIHTLSEDATAQYESARETVRQFIDAEAADEIIFTSGTTASVNMAAMMVEKLILQSLSTARAGTISEDDPETVPEIVVTQMEHHSNLLPWLEMARRHGFRLEIIPVKEDGTLDLEAFEASLNEHTRVVACTEVSNVTGIRNPLETIIPLIRKKTDALILIDGAQGVVHGRQSIRKLQPDFYCFSGHKLGAPTGTGVLYIRKALQAQVSPVWYGGGIVGHVSDGFVSYLDGPSLFEPGTPNYAGVVGLKAALEFWMEQENTTPDLSNLSAYSFTSLESILQNLGKTMHERETELLEELETELELLEVRVLAPHQKRYGCLSFVVDDVSTYDLCRMLDGFGIAVRSGHMCAQPYVQALGCERVIRVSVAPYNTHREIEQFCYYLSQILSELRAATAFHKERMLDGELPMNEMQEKLLEQFRTCTSDAERYAYLKTLSEHALTTPKDYRKDLYRLMQCQADIQLLTGWDEDRRLVLIDSESVSVKGVLAMIQLIYLGRTRQEIDGFSCHLLEEEMIAGLLSHDQQKGFKRVLDQIHEREED